MNCADAQVSRTIFFNAYRLHPGLETARPFASSQALGHPPPGFIYPEGSPDDKVYRHLIPVVKLDPSLYRSNLC